MTTINITPQNVENHKWIWDFLEKQRQSGQYSWRANQNFTYNGTSFQFQQPVFARKRKDSSRGYAYEIQSNERLGAGAFGAVYRISCTISNGKTGVFQVTNKNRVVKIQGKDTALDEYKMATYADHLHAKYPTSGCMVMKEIAGVTLYKFLLTHSLSRADKLELTKALLRTYKQQAADKFILHRDLHTGNILIKHHPGKLNDPFEINIVDYGLAKPYRQPNNRYQATMYLYWDLTYVLMQLWPASGRPEVINNLLTGDFTADDNFFQLFEELLIAPSEHSQKTFEKIGAYFRKLSITEKILAEQLKNIIHDATKKSTANNLEPLKTAVLECKTLLNDRNLDPNNYFTFLFDENAQKQTAFDNIFDYFQTLESKGKQLMQTSQRTEGEQLCALVATLREKTFNAAYKPAHEQSVALNECGNLCKQLLLDNQSLLNAHRNNNYIWAEIGVVFCLLIVLYPLAAGINYLKTGRFGFFSQTNAAAGAEKMREDFNTLNSIRAY